MFELGRRGRARGARQRLTYERHATAQQVIARAYSIIILDHTLVITDAFRRGLHAPGFALVRPTRETLLKQYLAADFVGDDETFKRLARSRPRIDSKALQQLSAQQPDAWPVWNQLSPWLTDCTHGGPGQLVGNNLRPCEGYPGEMFWTAMLVSTVAMLATSGWFWHHMGHEDRAQRVLKAMGSENWDHIQTMRNGQTVRIVAPATAEADHKSP